MTFFSSAVKPNNTAALYVIMALVGMCSIPMLPVTLELAVEVTRNAEGSSAILWAGYVTLFLVCMLPLTLCDA